MEDIIAMGLHISQPLSIPNRAPVLHTNILFALCYVSGMFSDIYSGG